MESKIDFTNLKKKIKDYCYSSKEVIEYQSFFYYNNRNLTSELGFETLAQMETIYPLKVAQLLNDFAFYELDKDKIFKILELGGGTGKFYSILSKELQKKNWSFEYTIVDIATAKYSKNLENSPSLRIIQSSFEEFAKKNNEIFDVLILNEALDMWAGEDRVVNIWEENDVPVKPYWVLVDTKDNSLVKKKAITKIKSESIDQYYWQAIYIENEGEKVLETLNRDYQAVITIPNKLIDLLSKIELFAIIQDYWSYGNDSNTLRAQTKGSETVWIPSLTIPFAKVDVTYSPNQGQLLDLLTDKEWQVTTFQATNSNHFDDTIYAIADETKEILVLFSKKALEIQYNK